MTELKISDSEYEFSAIRASGPGGQNVNKVSSAVQLRFDINRSSLAPHIKSSLLEFSDSRISNDGTIVIKAQRFRTQDKNKQDAVARLHELVKKASFKKPKRIATRPGRAAKERRLKEKKMMAGKKSGRSSPRSFDD